MMTSPTYHEIATNYQLWQIYADPSGIDSQESFEAMSIGDKTDILEASFGMEWESKLRNMARLESDHARADYVEGK